MNADESQTPSPADATDTSSESTPSNAPAPAPETDAASEAAPAPSDASGTSSEPAPAPADAPAPAPEVTTEAPAAEAPAPSEAPAAEPPAPPAPPVAPAAPVPSPRPPEPAPTQVTLPAQEAANLAMSQGMVADTLKNYLAAMKPATPITAESGAAHQLNLYRMLTNVVNRPGPEFVPLWTQILTFANEHLDGLFGPRHLFRFFSDLRLPATEIRNFERLLNLIVATADPKTRSLGIKSVDMNSLLKNMALPNIVQNLRSYYHV